jgi:hypothetical protein
LAKATFAFENKLALICLLLLFTRPKAASVCR